MEKEVSNNVDTKSKRMIITHPLAQRVLAVAVITEYAKRCVDWAVYIDAVEGYNHQAEKYKVAEQGDKQSRDLAHLLFPQLDIMNYRR